jgi:hypothetical protein
MRPVLQMRPTTERERPIFEHCCKVCTGGGKKTLSSTITTTNRNTYFASRYFVEFTCRFTEVSTIFFCSNNGTSTTVCNITLHDKSAGSSSGTCYVIDCRCSTYKFINFCATRPAAVAPTRCLLRRGRVHCSAPRGVHRAATQWGGFHDHL